jgi:hypothetical protein
MAKFYGQYKTSAQLEHFEKGNKYEVLCDDGNNYIVDVKEFNPLTKSGRLHFQFWSATFDYNGAFDKLYLADEGTYTKGQSKKNSYHITDTNDTSVVKRPKSTNLTTLKERTCYEDGHFDKPYKKRVRVSASEDFSNSADRGNSHTNYSPDVEIQAFTRSEANDYCGTSSSNNLNQSTNNAIRASVTSLSLQYKDIYIKDIDALRQHKQFSEQMTRFVTLLNLSSSTKNREGYSASSSSSAGRVPEQLSTSLEKSLKDNAHALEMIATLEPALKHYFVDSNNLTNSLKCKRQIDKYAREMCGKGDSTVWSLIDTARRDVDTVLSDVLYPYLQCKVSSGSVDQ